MGHVRRTAKAACDYGKRKWSILKPEQRWRRENGEEGRGIRIDKTRNYYHFETRRMAIR